MKKLILLLAVVAFASCAEDSARYKKVESNLDKYLDSMNAHTDSCSVYNSTH